MSRGKLMGAASRGLGRGGGGAPIGPIRPGNQEPPAESEPAERRDTRGRGGEGTGDPDQGQEKYERPEGDVVPGSAERSHFEIEDDPRDPHRPLDDDRPWDRAPE